MPTDTLTHAPGNILLTYRDTVLTFEGMDAAAFSLCRDVVSTHWVLVSWLLKDMKGGLGLSLEGKKS